MRNQKNRKPVSPIYAIGITCLLYSIFFHLADFGGILKCAILAWAVYSLVKCIVRKDEKTEKKQETPKQAPKAAPKQEPAKHEPEPVEKPVEEEPKPTGNPELDAVILEGRKSVKRIQELNDAIPDYKISAKLKQIEILTASII